jgi:hypothetical protein
MSERPLVFAPSAYTGKHKFLWLLPEKWHAYAIARELVVKMGLPDSQILIVQLPAGAWKVSTVTGWRHLFFRCRVTPYDGRFTVQT